MEQNHKLKSFYQKPTTWLAISFLTGASAMLAAFGLIGTPATNLGGSSGIISLSDPNLYNQGNAAYLDTGLGSGLPVVLINQPLEGQQFSANAIIPIKVTAPSLSDLKSISILVDDNLLETC